MKNIIIIHGFARHGKNEIASELERKLEKTRTIAYGDYVKTIAYNQYNWNGEKDEKGRSLLQYIGNTARKYNPLFWISVVIHLIKWFSEHVNYIVIPDARYQNEIDIPKDVFGDKVVTINVIRPDFDNGLTEVQKVDDSEKGLTDYNFDCVIINDGTLDDLHKKVDEFINLYLKRD